MAFWDKIKGQVSGTVHGRIAQTEQFIQEAEGKIIAAKDSIELKKQKMGELIERASGLHAAHDELDILKEKFNSLLG